MILREIINNYFHPRNGDIKMNKLMKMTVSLSAFLFIIVASNSYSQSAVQRMDDAETRADRLEDRADQIREADEEAKEAVEKMREKQADRIEDRADQLRDSAEDEADR